MKKLLCLALLLAAVSCASAQGQFGLGIKVGVVNGINGKYVNSSGNATECEVAWGVNDRFFFQTTYNFMLKNLAERKPGSIEFYAGPGIFIRSPERDDSRFGLAGNFGVGWLWDRHVEFMMEMSPQIGMSPITRLDFTAGLGFRFLF